VRGDILAANPEQNVLLVTIDTLRGDALSSYGGPARTPNIDAIAATGVRFSFAHAQAVVTLPSHASILTGTYPFQHGYRENSGYRLKPGMPTLATILKGQGFATGAFVAAFPLDARFGLTPGFDVYDGRFDDLTGGGFTIVERPASAVVALATSWIDAQAGGRWLAWVHVYEPHAPYRPPPPYDREYADRPYFGEVAAADAALGPLFAAVRRSARPTLVVITGDHGEALGEHGEETHGIFLYDETIHVPLLFKLPAEKAAVAALKKTLYLDQGFVLAHFALANLSLQRGKKKDAARHLENAAALLGGYGDDELVPGSDGLSARRLGEIIAATMASVG
jgi:arylsulfatase A-like enzyme